MGTLISVAAEAANTAPTPAWMTVVGALLGSGLISALVTTVVTGRNSAMEARRQGYAEAIQAVLAWGEFPYRVRRRTSDTSEALAALSGLGHDLQERRARTLAWVAGEDAALHDVFAQNVGGLAKLIGPTVSEAWSKPAVADHSEMVLSGWGLGPAVDETVGRLTCAVRYRFSRRGRIVRLVPWLYRWRLRRFMPSKGVRPSVDATPLPRAVDGGGSPGNGTNAISRRRAPESDQGSQNGTPCEPQTGSTRPRFRHTITQQPL